MTDNGLGAPAAMHERARRLLTIDRVEGLTATERAWLEAHLDGCPVCMREAEVLDTALQQLQAAPSAPAGLVRRTQLAVRVRAEAHGREQGALVPLWVAAAFSAVWTLATAPVAWWALARVGRAAHLPDFVWQAGFILWWFLPATLAAAVLAWRHVAGNAQSSSFQFAQWE
jgi:hypothetical protein